MDEWDCSESLPELDESNELLCSEKYEIIFTLFKLPSANNFSKYIINEIKIK